tara:strand:- start:1395 stop:1595 length:201 start_codon:yes stop_codon:yes gene_type:complete
MKIRELFGFAGIPMAHTAKPQGLRKVTKSYMGKVRTYYEPTGNKFNENNRNIENDPFKGTSIEGKD